VANQVDFNISRRWSETVGNVIFNIKISWIHSNPVNRVLVQWSRSNGPSQWVEIRRPMSVDGCRGNARHKSTFKDRYRALPCHFRTSGTRVIYETSSTWLFPFPTLARELEIALDCPIVTEWIQVQVLGPTSSSLLPSHLDYCVSHSTFTPQSSWSHYPPNHYVPFIMLLSSFSVPQSKSLQLKPLLTE